MCVTQVGKVALGARRPVQAELVGNGGLDDSSKTLREGSLYLLRTEKKAPRSRNTVRPSGAADLTPAEDEAKKDEGGGAGLETDELGHEFLCSVQFFPELAEAEVRGTEGGAQQREAFYRVEQSNPSRLLPIG